MKSILKRDTEVKGIVAYAGQLSVNFGSISPTLHCSVLSAVCGLLRLDSYRCSAAGGVHKRPRGRNNGASEKLHGPEVNWQLSTENIFLVFVVDGYVKRSAGCSTTTSWNGYSATYRSGAWHASANESIFSPSFILGWLQLSNWGDRTMASIRLNCAFKRTLMVCTWIHGCQLSELHFWRHFRSRSVDAWCVHIAGNYRENIFEMSEVRVNDTSWRCYDSNSVCPLQIALC